MDKATGAIASASELLELAEGENEDGGWKAVKEGASVRVLDGDGKQVPSMTAYWFAWCAFYPGGSVYGR